MNRNTSSPKCKLWNLHSPKYEIIEGFRSLRKIEQFQGLIPYSMSDKYLASTVYLKKVPNLTNYLAIVGGEHVVLAKFGISKLFVPGLKNVNLICLQSKQINAKINILLFDKTGFAKILVSEFISVSQTKIFNIYTYIN